MNGRRSAVGLRLALALLAVLAVVSGCGGSSSPSSPSNPSSGAPVDLNGTWAGSASDASGPGQMTWRLTQSGNTFSGTLVIADSAGSSVAQGSISGTVAGSAVQFAVTIPPGGFTSAGASCTAAVTGSGSATATTITGTYSGSQSCSGAISGGSLTLSKQ